MTQPVSLLATRPPSLPETRLASLPAVKLLCTIIGKMTVATAITATYKTSILMNTPPRMIMTMMMTKITTTVAAALRSNL